MLRNTSDVDVSDPQYKFNKFDLQMSAQPQVLLEPAQICFLNGELFNESEAFYETSLDSLNQFRITGVVQHPFHQHINSFQMYVRPPIAGTAFRRLLISCRSRILI